jgi:nucleotide-binding universal stress UspA family protein
MYERILAALGGKETDEVVVAHARRLAMQMDAQIVLLRVITVADDEGGGFGRQFQLEIGSSGWRQKNRAEADLARLERRLRLRGPWVKTALVVGTRSEAEEIVSYAAENNCDLIALASDSRPWYKRWIGGSPADGVYRKATVPTLFVNDGTRRVPVPRTAPKANTMMVIFGSADL